MSRSPFDNDRAIFVASLAAVAAAFLPALRGGFVWDDTYYVVANPILAEPLAAALGKLFTIPFMGNYHPLTLLSLILDRRIGGDGPAFHHAMNVALHLVNVALVGRLLVGLTGRPKAAILGALVWGIHPLRVESVAWISARKDLLYTAFFLIALLAYRRYAAGVSPGRSYLVAIGAGLASCLSKGMAVALAPALLVIDFGSRRPMDRRSLGDKVPFVAMALAFGSVAVWAQQTLGATSADGPRAISDRLLFAGHAVTLYLRDTLWPFSLSAYHPYPTAPGEPLPREVWLHAGIAALVAAGVVASLRWTRSVAFAAALSFVSVALVLQVLPVGTAVRADRYTYLASVGLAYLIAVAAAAAWDGAGSGGRRFALGATAAAGIAVLGTATWTRTQVWRDGITLWSDVIERYPDSPTAREYRGSARAAAGDPVGAIRDFDEAIRLRPDFGLALYNRGVERKKRGEFAGAALDFDGAIRAQPPFPEAFRARGDSRAEAGDAAGARSDYLEAIRLRPGYAEAHYNLGYLELERGRNLEAAAAFANAVRYAPGFVPGWLHLGTAWVRLGRVQEGIRAFDRALAIDPAFAPARQARAEALGAGGAPSGAPAGRR